MESAKNAEPYNKTIIKSGIPITRINKAFRLIFLDFRARRIITIPTNALTPATIRP